MRALYLIPPLGLAQTPFQCSWSPSLFETLPGKPLALRYQYTRSYGVRYGSGLASCGARETLFLNVPVLPNYIVSEYLSPTIGRLS